jgi:exodeoxyribonuclease VII large subunit
MNGSSEQPRVYTVSEITRNIKKSLEGKQEFTGIWIKGEIFNLTFHSSGHIYFTLKDNDAVIAAVFFRYANKNLTIKLKEGMNVLAFGNITVFEKRGSYQINVSMVRLEGIGDLQMRIEQLKAKLMHEGIFDPKRKKNLPFMPLRSVI